MASSASKSFLVREAGECQLSEQTLVLAANAAAMQCSWRKWACLLWRVWSCCSGVLAVPAPCPARGVQLALFYSPMLCSWDWGWATSSTRSSLPGSLPSQGGLMAQTLFPTAMPPLGPWHLFLLVSLRWVLREILRRPLEYMISPSNGTDETNRSGTLFLSK